MLRCPVLLSQQKWQIKTITTLQKQMKQLNTEFDLKNTMYCAIAEWFKTGHLPLYKYPEKIHEVIWSQGAIGWRQIFNGKNISSLARAPRKYKNKNRTSSNELYLGRINSRDLFTIDDRFMGNEK